MRKTSVLLIMGKARSSSLAGNRDFEFDSLEMRGSWLTLYEINDG